MDGLSSAASAIAVVSLAADTAKKLCDFWSSIKDAPEDIRNIITDLELLTSVLAEMASEAQRTSPDATLAAVLQSCTGKLKSLTALTNNLEPSFSSRSSRIRKWSAFKFVLKSEKLTRFQEVLESLKGTLVLAQQNRHSRLSRIQHETELEKLMTISEKLSSLSLQHSAATVTTFSKEPAVTQNHIATLRAETARVNNTLKDPLLRLGFAVGSESAVHQIANKIGTNDSINPVYDKGLNWNPSDTLELREDRGISDVKLLTKRTLREWDTTTNYFFGTIYTCSTTKQLQSSMFDSQETDDEDLHYEHQSSFVIRPAAWLVSLGLKSGLRVGLFNSSVRGWKSSLDTFCAVPDDSLIFDLSRDGNLSAVRTLFSRGLASVRDTNSAGETPLFVAAASHRPELCKFLIAAGADKGLRSEREKFWGKNPSPILAACYAKTNEVPEVELSTAIDTIRLFTDEMDFVEADGDGWLALSCVNDLYSRYEPDIAKLSTKSDLFIWMLRSFSPEIRKNLKKRCYATVLSSVMVPGREKVATLLLELGPVGAIDTVGSEGDFTALQYHLLCSDCDELEIGMILKSGADIHHLGLELEFSPREETPLSLALYSFRLFRGFAKALKERQIDMDEFVLHELRENFPLVNDGWTEQTLRALFEYEFEPDDGYIFLEYCDECHFVLTRKFGCLLQVEVAWQRHLEDVKEWHSESSSEKMISYEDLVGNVPDTSQYQTPMDPIQDPGGVEKCETEYETDQVSWKRRFWQHRVVCIHCWSKFKRGLSNPRPTMQNDPAEEDDDSEEDFSPYLFNT